MYAERELGLHHEVINLRNGSIMSWGCSNIELTLLLEAGNRRN